LTPIVAAHPSEGSLPGGVRVLLYEPKHASPLEI
jgi:hypothetical protein